MKTGWLYVLLFFLLFLSCSPKMGEVHIPGDVEEALVLAEENREELEKVISHFSKHEEDSLKLRSALFLISNMPLHSSVLMKNKSTNLMPYIKMADKKLFEIFKDQRQDSLQSESFLDEVDKIKDFVQAKMARVNFKEKIVYYGPISDVKVFDARFLTEHIEHAFTLRELPMVSQLSFQDFCDYILPYRLIDQKVITQTGKDYHAIFYKYLKTSANDEAEIMDALERFKLVISYFRRILGDYPYSKYLGFEELFFNSPSYDCYDMVNTQGLILNACGIPAKACINLSFKNRSGSHAFISLPERYANVGGFIPQDYVKKEKSQYFPGYAYRTNFYRLYFSRQPNNPKMLVRDSMETVPDELDNVRIEEVSKAWCPVDSFRLPFTVETGNKLAYLASFSVDRGIMCITWGIINREENFVEFTNGLPNTLYFPVYMEGNEMKMFGRPFYYRGNKPLDSTFVYLNEEVKVLDSVHVTRKYPIKEVSISRARKLVGFTVVASDNKEFDDPDTLYTITEPPAIHFQDMDLNNTREYKYYKINSTPEIPYITITEIEYLTKKEYGYENTAPPVPLPVFEYDDLIRNREKESLVKIVDTCINSKYAEYDGNVLTARAGVKEIILQLSKPQRIDVIRFSPMNAHNGVYPGNVYTLFVWGNDRWVAVGKPIRAQYNYLLFKELKTNTLYWLKNHSEGREELPFILDEKGKQKFLYFDVK